MSVDLRPPHAPSKEDALRACGPVLRWTYTLQDDRPYPVGQGRPYAALDGEDKRSRGGHWSRCHRPSLTALRCPDGGIHGSWTWVCSTSGCRCIETRVLGPCSGHRMRARYSTSSGFTTLRTGDGRRSVTRIRAPLSLAQPSSPSPQCQRRPWACRGAPASRAKCDRRVEPEFLPSLDESGSWSR